MSKLSNFLFFFLYHTCIFCQSPNIIRFESLNFNTKEIVVRSYKDDYIVAGRSRMENGNAIKLAKIQNNKYIEWSISFHQEDIDLHIQDIAVNDYSIILLIKTINHLQNPLYNKDGLILCYDLAGQFLWKKEIEYIPISACSFNQKDFAICYLFNHIDKKIQRFNQLGVFIIDSNSKEINNKLLRETIPYSSEVFLNWAKDKNEIELFFNQFSDGDKSVKQINFDSSLNIIKECQEKLTFYATNKVELNTHSLFIGEEFIAKERKRKLWIDYINCSFPNCQPKINKILNIGESYWINDNYIVISKNNQSGLLEIYEIDKKMTNLKLVESYGLSENLYNVTLNSKKDKLLCWTFINSNDNYDSFLVHLGLIEISLKK